jgi:hypothetical protein
MAVHFNEIVPWGRARKEYELIFSLTEQDLGSRILDCGGGPASFNAEASANGIQIISADPIYTFSSADIRKRFEATVDSMMAQVRATPDDWTWSYHRNPDHLLRNRRAVLETFLADYDQGRRERRYVVGELPLLPFASNSFGIAVCSHLLFLYSDLLSAEFHIQSVLELCRAAREVRIFPLLTLRRNLSPHIEAVRSALKSAGWMSEVVRVNYELQRDGNQMLRIFRPEDRCIQ